MTDTNNHNALLKRFFVALSLTPYNWNIWQSFLIWLFGRFHLHCQIKIVPFNFSAAWL